MSEQRFDLFLTGKLADGSSREQALQLLARLFKREPDRLGGLLAGRPTRIRKNLTAAEVEKFQLAFDRLGILTDVISTLESGSPPLQVPPKRDDTRAQSSAIARHAAAADSGPLALDPVGTPVLRTSERRRITPPTINTDMLSLAATGQRLSEEKPAVARTPRTDHLSLATPGSDLSDKPAKKPGLDIDQLSRGLSIAEPGADVLEEAYRKVGHHTPPDTRHLHIQK